MYSKVNMHSCHRVVKLNMTYCLQFPKAAFSKKIIKILIMIYSKHM